VSRVRRDPLDRLEGRRGLVGLVLLLVAGAVFAVSWGASRGLPWKDYRRASVLVPDAAQIVVGDEVREAGRRVGRVERVAAVEAAGGRIVARIDLQLEPGEAALPVDSTVRVAPVNVFGNQVVELVRGRDARTVPAGRPLPLSRARRGVELADVLADADAAFGRRLQGVVREAGAAVAGRGTAIASGTVALRALLPRLERAATLLADPATRLEPLLVRLDEVAGVLDRLAPLLPSLLDDGAAVLEALERSGPALERTLVAAPGAVADTTAALGDVLPLLADLRVVAERLAPVARRLPTTVAASERLVDRAGRLLDPATRLRESAGRVATIAGTLADERPAIERLLADLRATNAPLGRTVRTIGDAEVHCGVGGLLARNLPSAVATGDRAGAWLTGVFVVLDPEQLLSSAGQASGLHVDPLPRVGADGCDVANERWLPGRRTGRVPADRYVVRGAPPAGVLDRARRAGLLDRFEEAGR